MQIIHKVSHEKMVIQMKKESTKKFTACEPDRCPRCKVSDG